MTANGSSQIVSCEVLSVPIAEIVIGDRIGFFNQAHAADLAESMAKAGQQSPIHLRRNGNKAGQKKWTLIAGLHRLRAAESIGWTEIDAIKVLEAAKDDTAEQRRWELAENMNHRHRRPIERAMMMTAFAELEKSLDNGEAEEKQQVRAARARWHPIENSCASVTMTDTHSYRNRTATAFAVSLATFERHMRVHRAIVEELPDLAQALNDHPLGESLQAMTSLAKLPGRDEITRTNCRRKVAELLLARDDWPNVKAILVAAGIHDSNGSRVDPNNRRAVVINTFANMAPREKQKCLEELPRHLNKEMARKLAIQLTTEFDR